MLDLWLLLGSSLALFGMGYMIVQIDVVIPIIFGRLWKGQDGWWRQTIGVVLTVCSVIGFLFLASKSPILIRYLPQNTELGVFAILITFSCFSGVLYANLQLRKAPEVVASIINAMFPSTSSIPVGARDVGAAEKILNFLDKIGGPYNSVLLFLAEGINSPIASWYFLSTFTRFSELSEENQRLFVRRWTDDEELLVRSLAHAFKAMACLGYYTDPRVWKEIGFPGPFVPEFPQSQTHTHDVPHHKNNESTIQITTKTDSPKIFGITRLQNRKFAYQLVESDIDSEADVCIVGSGAAGAVLARELCLHNEINKVVVLESGSYNEGEDFNQRELDMISTLWKGGGLTFTQDFSIFIGQGQTLGGTTVINHAICIDTPQVVLKEWEEMGVSKWITDRNEFQKSLDEVKKEINVYPVPQDEINRNNQILKEGAELLQIPKEGHGPNPRNCINCRECGFSHLGCHYDAKQSTLITYIPWALQTGKCHVYCDCFVEKIITEKDLAKKTIAYFKTKNGNTLHKLTIKSKIIILCAGAINSTAILLRSKLPDPNKVVGKGLSIHPSPLVIGEFSEAINAYQGIPMSYNISHYSVLNGVPGANSQKTVTGKPVGGFMLESVFPNPGQLGAFLPDIGEEHQKLMKKIENYAAAGILIRDTSKGIITLNMSGEPVVQYKLDENDKENLAAGIRMLSKIYLKKGAHRIIITRREDPIIDRSEYEKDPEILEKIITPENVGQDKLIVGAVHPQGGNRMGEDPKNSVVNSKCQHHQINNLFVCDASVFPTATGVNPMLTIMGIAKRTAKFIKENWQEFKSYNP